MSAQFALPDFLSILWLQVLIVAAWLGVVVLAAEAVYRSQSVSSEIGRKIVHVGSGNVILLAWWLGIPAWVGIGASIVFSSVALLSYQIPILPSVNSVGRKSLGTFFYAVSFGVLIAWFWTIGQPCFAALGILIMTWGDGFAALIGQKWGAHGYKLWGMSKSWEGSFAMWLISFLISVAVLQVIPFTVGQLLGVGLAVATVATALEAFSKLGIDNLTVPLGSAAIAYWLSQVLL